MPPETPGTIVRGYLEMARSGDWDRASGYFADDVVFRIPGRSRFAGEQRGRAAALEYIESARALTRGRHVAVELIDVLEGSERVALLVSERFPLGEREVEIRRANVYRIANGKIAEVWIFEADQYEVDALFETA